MFHECTQPGGQRRDVISRQCASADTTVQCRHQLCPIASNGASQARRNELDAGYVRGHERIDIYCRCNTRLGCIGTGHVSALRFLSQLIKSNDAETTTVEKHQRALSSPPPVFLLSLPASTQRTNERVAIAKRGRTDVAYILPATKRTDDWLSPIDFFTQK